MRNVNLLMTDSNGNNVERTIDIVNAMSSGSECWELKGTEDQRNRLEMWINERGNEQHATKLTLISWSFS